MTTEGAPVLAAMPDRERPGERSQADDVLATAFVEHYDALLRYARWLLADRTIAADLVQEAFARFAARRIPVRDPRAYLFQIVTNLARSEWRRQRRAAHALPEIDPGIDQAEAIAVRSAVLSLPAREREVIALFYYADVAVAEIARLTGRPEGTVKSQLYNARQRLARALEECHE